MTAQRKDIPFREYLAHPAENNSGLKHMAKSPKEYLYRKTHGREDTEALSIGRHIHTAVLEPELFESSFREWRGGLTQKGEHSMRAGTTAHKEFMAKAKADGVEVMSRDDLKTCMNVREAVNANPNARAMLVQADAEVSIFWEHRFGIACKMRADLLRERSSAFLTDLKSAQDVSQLGFKRASKKYEYPVQFGMYQAGVLALTGKLVPVFVIAVEKVPPFDCSVFEIKQWKLDEGREIFEERLARVIECRDSGRWPGAVEGIADLYEDEDEELDWEGLAV